MNQRGCKEDFQLHDHKNNHYNANRKYLNFVINKYPRNSFPSLSKDSIFILVKKGAKRWMHKRDIGRIKVIPN